MLFNLSPKSLHFMTIKNVLSLPGQEKAAVADIGL